MTGSPSFDLSGWLWPSLLVSLRIAPVLTFAPPFSLVPVPVAFRLFFGIAIASCICAMQPMGLTVDVQNLSPLLLGAVGELLVGAAFVVAFQIAFSGLYVAGRTVDIQVGLGLATLIDPGSKSRTPLVGMLFALLAGSVFFAVDGPASLLGLFSESLKVVPLGQGHVPSTLLPLSELFASSLAIGVGAAGGVILILFVVDLSIAALSRTVPQMNVLVLGFQVKSLLLLVLLPMVFGLSGAFFVRLLDLTLSTIPRLV